MGLLAFLAKEMCINRLVESYTMAYECTDMEAIRNLRQNYTKNELKSILKRLLNAEKRCELQETLRFDNPFKER